MCWPFSCTLMSAPYQNGRRNCPGKKSKVSHFRHLLKKTAHAATDSEDDYRQYRVRSTRDCWMQWIRGRTTLAGVSRAVLLVDSRWVCLLTSPSPSRSAIIPLRDTTLLRQSNGRCVSYRATTCIEHLRLFGLSPFPKCIIIMCLPVPVFASSCHVFFATCYR